MVAYIRVSVNSRATVNQKRIKLSLKDAILGIDFILLRLANFQK